MEEGTEEWLKKNGVDFDLLDGEGDAPCKAIIKGNEKGSFGVGKDLLADFNDRVVGKVKISKIKKGT